MNAQLSRDLAWDRNKKSWRWHKTWRVPDCLVTADNESLHGIADLEAHISVVCQAEQPHQLEDAGVQSLDRSILSASLQLVDGLCRFSRLRLVATTSTFGGRLFHFVVSIVKRDGDSGNITALASVISTAFAVYSRKNADKKRKAIDREAMISGRWSEGYSFVPFEPKELNRKFIKKTTNTNGFLIEEEITNSWDGLLAYFQAPNIRFKIRHPLFLAIRFSNVLVILRDALRFPQESEEALRSFICSCGFPLNCRRDPAVKIGHGEFLPPWLIAFRSVAMKDCQASTIQKLADLMKIVKGPALGFVPDDSLLPQRYSATFDVNSLGKLYNKLYAIEFAAGIGGNNGQGDDGGGDGGDQGNGDLVAVGEMMFRRKLTAGDVGCKHENTLNEGDNTIVTKRAKTKVEPVHADGLVRLHPCGAPILHPDSGEEGGGTSLSTTNVNDVSANGNKHGHGSGHEVSSSSTSSHGPSELMRSSFESYFVALHGELRMLLQKVVELVTQCVTAQRTSDEHVDILRKAYEDFTEALSVHAYVEEHVLFKKLSDRVPNVTESYSVDHEMEKGRMNEISNIMKNMEARKITELFLKISELSAMHKIHMDKEEYHLLPYFLKNFDDSEISDLIRQCQTTINEKLGEQKGDTGVLVVVNDDSDKISLLNPRHQNAIERALRAAGMYVDNDSVEADVEAPERIDDQSFFEQHNQMVEDDQFADDVRVRKEEAEDVNHMNNYLNTRNLSNMNMSMDMNMNMNMSMSNILNGDGNGQSDEIELSGGGDDNTNVVDATISSITGSAGSGDVIGNGNGRGDDVIALLEEMYSK